VPLARPLAATAEGPVADAASRSSLVMVIDDDVTVLEAVRLTLESFGYRVLAAGSPTAALAALQASDSLPDAVVTDYQLGDGVNGLDTLALLRSEAGRFLPGIVLTGDTSGGKLRAQASAHGIEVLLKPVMPQQLESALDRCLGRR
jgi:CheY-like chemotaxis protein